jgi:hypothetical protein
MDNHGQKYSRNRFSPPQARATLRFDYDPVCGRLMVTAPQGGFVIFHGVPIDAYIWLRFSPTPETYLRERLIGEFSFICSSACWPKA